MQLIAILLLSVMIAVSVLPFGSALLVGAVFGALINWCVNLQNRIKQLEANQGRQSVTETAATDASAPPAPVLKPNPRPQPQPQSKPQDSTAPWPKRSTAERATTTRKTGLEKLISRCKTWLTTGNVPVKLGVILSLFGLAFLAREAIDRSWLVLPIEFRLAGIAAFGIALLIIGWRLRDKRAGYGLSLQGGGIAITYLTVFAAYGMYELMPAALAFVLMVATTGLAGWLAVRQNARALAVLGIIGGFMAPVLASSGSGNHVILFSYYAILNTAIVVIAFTRAWRELNVLGFVFTFVIGSI